MKSDKEIKNDNIRSFSDRFRAHSTLFSGRHEYPFAPFHRLLIDDFWSPEQFYIDLGFRECGKTTLVEEGIALAACLETFRNCLIIAATQDLACHILHSVKIELESNEMLLAHFGDVRGQFWQQTKVELSSGACIQAIGRDQSIRGTKHREWRPDLVLVNDFEDDEEVLTPDGRRKTLRWFLRVLLPACDRARRRIRIYDTIRDADSVPMMLIRRGWPHRMIPISYLDEEGEERSSWPGHPTLTMEWIEAERQTYSSLGEQDIWDREYMMVAASQGSRTFTPDMIRVEPVVRTWQAVYAMIDPARSGTGRRRYNSLTGWAVWSWVRNRLIIWDGGRGALAPDAIVDLGFDLHEKYGLVQLGIEEDGLKEFLMQPFRQEMLRRGRRIPIYPVAAITHTRSAGKMRFISGLQPFFKAGEVIFAKEIPVIRDELLSFSMSSYANLDAINALAYALLLRPGRLVYEAFNPAKHIDPEAARGSKYLAVNATRTMVSAALVGFSEGRISILADWIAEGPPSDVLEGIVREASLTAGSRVVMMAGSRHWDQWQNVGLVQAARSLGVEARPAGDPVSGRELVRRELERSTAAGPSFTVSPDAEWSIRAMVGGYSRSTDGPIMAADPVDNEYRLLMEGIESLAGLIAFRREDDDYRNYQYDDAGRRYLSAMPASRMRAH